MMSLTFIFVALFKQVDSMYQCISLAIHHRRHQNMVNFNDTRLLPPMPLFSSYNIALPVMVATEITFQNSLTFP